MVLTGGEQLFGYAVLFSLFETAELQNIAVRKEYRGGGLGEKLLGLCLSEARKRNAENFSVPYLLPGDFWYNI